MRDPVIDTLGVSSAAAAQKIVAAVGDYDFCALAAPGPTEDTVGRRSGTTIRKICEQESLRASSRAGSVSSSIANSSP